jgi:hypothetical protein
MIEWVEPFGPNSEPVYCRVTEQTAIATQRHIGRTMPTPYEYESDERALEDFMVVHWAESVTEETADMGNVGV